MRSISKRRTNGFTLLEALITMVVLAILVMGFITMQQMFQGTSQTANRKSMAGTVLTKQIEEMRIRIAQAPATNFPPIDSSASENGINVRWTVASAFDSKGVAVTDVRCVTFTASWTVLGIKPDSLVIVTNIARNF